MNPLSGLFKFAYWPICRAYARHLGDKPADSFFRFLCSFQFLRTHHFWPNFYQPKRFSEKLWHRMLYERDPIFTLISDKLRVRNYIAEKVGKEYLIPLLWKGTNPEEIPFDNLPSKFVIKTNHGCGYNIIVKNKQKLNYNHAKLQLKEWLSENYGLDKFLGIAWSYKNIIPQIIIESFIEEDNKPPIDYKFYCFSGHAEVLTLHFDRHEDHKTKALDRNFKSYEPVGSVFKQCDIAYHQPSNFQELINVAEALSTGFDFIRVDLYNIENKIYFGELTLYPGGVSRLRGFDVSRHDQFLGKKWK